MGFTRSTTDIKVHQKLGDYPNQDDGLTPEELKKRFDYPAETLQNDLNKLEEELEKQVASASIGAIPFDDNDTSPNNVQGKLYQLRKDIQEISLGQIPDGTITSAKIEQNYEKTIAKKDGTLQMNLNSEKLGGKTLSEIGAYQQTELLASGQYNKIPIASTWETMSKDEKKTFNLPNKRFLLITLLVENSSGQKNYNYVFLLDTKFRTIYTLTNEERVFIYANNFDSINPKVYALIEVGSSERGIGLAFLNLENNALEVQTGIYAKTGLSTTATTTYNVQMSVAEFLAELEVQNG